MEKKLFNLKSEFLEQYTTRKAPLTDIGYITYKRTYSRPLENGETEEWWQTVKRVVEGSFSVQKYHCLVNKLPWSEKKAQNSAEKMYDLIYNFKFTPPGRGLWMMGTDYMYSRWNSTSLQNCGFSSTENISTDFSEPFVFMMDMSMLGVGVGFDTKGAGRFTVKEPKKNGEVYVVEDSREGWVALLERLLKAYSGEATLPKEIDYSQVRKAGEPLKGFGGTASGPTPLIEMYDDINKLLAGIVGEKITSGNIVDIMNLVGRCVVSGNIRRSAQIAFGEPDDDLFINLKNKKLYEKEMNHHRWASNNSIFAEVGMDYDKVADLTSKNGEPGFAWLDNMRKYSRMNGVVDNKDYRVAGGNPCLEQSLEHMELCNLVETYPSNHESLEEWYETLKYAYLYAKSVTLIPTHNPKTNSVMSRNRRIGCSISGITQAFTKFGRRDVFDAMNEGYDHIQEWDKTYSDWLGIPRSIKTTSIKPSGTVSLLANVTPGIHYPLAEYYIRRIRFQNDSPVLSQLKEVGYKTEKDKYSANTTNVLIPIKQKHFDRAASEVSMWEQLEIAAQVQQYWADNQVSATISFDNEEANDIAKALELYETRLKGISFLPNEEHGYEQPPYEPITQKKYEKLVMALAEINGLEGDTNEIIEKFCDGESCLIQ